MGTRTWKKVDKYTVVETTIIEVRTECDANSEHLHVRDFRRANFENMQSKGAFDKPCWICGEPTTVTWGPAYFTYPDPVQA